MQTTQIHSTSRMQPISCRQLSGVGERTAERLARLGIVYVEDLLFHLPLRYEDRTHVQLITQVSIGQSAVLDVTIDKILFPTKGRTRLLLQVRDESGMLSIRFFHLTPQQRRLFHVGARMRCYGEIRLGVQGLECIHPEYQIIDENASFPVDPYLTPIYPVTEGLSQMTFRKLIRQALTFFEKGLILRELLPKNILEKMNFLPLQEVLHFIHRPDAKVPMDLLNQRQHAAQKRLVFEELLAHRLALLQIKKTFKQQKAHPLPAIGSLRTQLIHQLPFQLTEAQKKVVAEISQDLSLNQPMLRLLQGDVGSGKTIVAALAVLQAIENGGQVAILAPTELLAEQHFQNFNHWFQSLGIQVVLLSGQMKVSVRREALQNIAAGNVQLVIGTHAIFQADVAFSHLVLLVIDEQHRFGVEQRALLREKGIQGDVFPHQLIMTATPIPRTLAMSLYADFDYSVIDALPPGRQPVMTRVVPCERRQDILMHLKNACATGSQAYWVCTLIEESEILQCQAAENTFQQLVTALPEFKVALLHGRMKTSEKEQVMLNFRKGEIHILVATTVIEVGVDVPAANLMIIENAERLGLAQLHQLRGRVGRGASSSYCVLVYQSPLSMQAKERLAVMRETTDGFKIAQRDLELRGAGEVLGTRQTGDISFRIADLLRDSDLFPAVQATAQTLLTDHLPQVEELIRRWIGENKKYGQV
ncbi:MAG: ATP-dependent DNA helicase RecG [Gammaproteobacteria bacterium]|nr:ATP-dependent DNA helicase RecG [Gammaproteobacteria bacterium]